MLSYRHGFHAGNWADAHKHAVLAALLLHLREKPAPFCVIDAFAGDGAYDLTAPEALKTAEFRDGIALLWRRDDAPPPVAWYLDRVRAMNPPGRLASYPGSPALIRAALRDSDRLVLGELHPTAYRNLRRWAGRDERIAVHRRDGLELIGALLPPKPPRGLVLLDPAYEVKSDYDRLPAALARALAKWPRGSYAVWYPVLAEARHEAMLAALAALPAAAMLRVEIAPPSPPSGLRAAGLVLINPPWRIDRALAAAGDWLAMALWPDGAGRHDLHWMKRLDEGDAPTSEAG